MMWPRQLSEVSADILWLASALACLLIPRDILHQPTQLKEINCV